MKNKRVKLIIIAVSIYIAVMAVVILRSGKGIKEVDALEYAELDEETDTASEEGTKEMQTGEEPESLGEAENGNADSDSQKSSVSGGNGDVPGEQPASGNTALSEVPSAGNTESQGTNSSQGGSTPATGSSSERDNSPTKSEGHSGSSQPGGYQVSGSLNPGSAGENDVGNRSTAAAGENSTGSSSAGQNSQVSDSISLVCTYYKEQKLCTISEGSSASGTVKIPQTVTEGGIQYTVAGIDDEAFIDSRNLISITLPDTITYIGPKAFQNCYSLAEIRLPSGLQSIDYWAFYNCSSLSEIRLPASVSYLGNEVFLDCSALKTVYASGTAAAQAAAQYNASQYSITG